MTKLNSLYVEYCTGCGLCKAVKGVDFIEDEKGYPVPDIKGNDTSFFEEVCPASGKALSTYQDGSVWGEYQQPFLGWSADEDIREKSSSGGVLTTVCIYLLENRLVDGIIQTKICDTDIRKAETVVSYTRKEVLSCMGSRYTYSSPLMNLAELVEAGKQYAFVGKPCDVSALRIYMDKIQPELKQSIKYLFSFFCAGQPSLNANDKLIKALGGTNLSDCKDLQYRGNGWPGFAILTMNDGSQQKMDYETSWMKILGRDVRRICRFCADGTGELADISCGDAWFLGDNGKPDFSERPGRNVIFARTTLGSDLLNNVVKGKTLVVTAFDPDREGLRRMQPYHYTRKASLLTYKFALRICGRSFPEYANTKLRMFAKGFPLRQKILRFGGTIRRVLKGII